MPSRAEVREILNRLLRETAEDLEGESLELLPWSTEPSALFRSVAEHVVAFANARGGTIVVGIRERTKGRKKAIHGVGAFDPQRLRREIVERTEPAVVVELEELAEPEGKLLLIHVPAGVPPHQTSDGTAKIRIGSETRPLTGMLLKRMLTATGDRSAEPFDDATEADLDPARIEEMRQLLRAEGDPEHGRLASLGKARFLDELGITIKGGVTLAGLLLAGKNESINRFIPQHEVTFLRFKSSTQYDQRKDMRGCLLSVLGDIERLVAVRTGLTTVPHEGLRNLEVPDLSWEVAREAVLNAVCHRDYWLRQGIIVGLHADALEVVSPGGFTGGITPENILRHGPSHRNEHLMRILHKIGLVNRIGMGIDRIYRELLRLGKGLPRYTSDESQVRLVVPLKTDPTFALFVSQETSKGKAMELDDLLILRTLTERSTVDRWSAAQVLQLPETEAAAKLVELRDANYLAVKGRGAGTRYSLTAALAELLGRQGVPLDDMLVRQRIVSELRRRGSLTSAEIRETTGLSKMRVYRTITELVKEGEARYVKAGRSSRLVPGRASSPARPKEAIRFTETNRKG